VNAESDQVPTGIGIDNWRSAHYARWAFQHVEELLATAVIARGSGPVVELPTVGSGIGEIPAIETGGETITVDAVMAGSATDGWAVAHRGVIVAEEYLGGMGPQTRHVLFSVSKSLVGIVVGALYETGALDVNAPVTAFVPALTDCGYAGATIRDLVDMRSGIAFSEDHRDPAAETHIMDQAIGWAPRRNDNVPTTLHDFLLTLRQKSPHGGPFEYRSCETNVLGWVCEAATGRAMPELLSELVWSRLGAAGEATILIDSVGTGIVDGGISACLTDMIRFGSLFLRDGVALTGEQVVPAAWLSDTFAGGADSRQAFAASPDDTGMIGGMYRNQMWFPYPGDNIALCLGMCGQMVYINRAVEMVGVKVSSQVHAHEPHTTEALRAFDAIAEELACGATR